jgi:hypothetical protein
MEGLQVYHAVTAHEEALQVVSNGVALGKAKECQLSDLGRLLPEGNSISDRGNVRPLVAS